MQSFFTKSGVLACAVLSLSHIHADTTEPVYELEDFVVSAGPGLHPVAEFAAPINLLDNETLSREGSGTLGDVLDWQPGVSASSFAAGASRPILRGFDGPRVRILDSGIEALDASSTSPDHGVAVEPLLTDRVEIIRGPATLLYGSSAIGGVVNVIGREIPREPVRDGYEGGAEFRYDSVSAGKTYLGFANVGGEQWAVGVTGLKRDAGNYTLPNDAQEDGSGDEQASSFVETDLFSLGGSWFFSKTNRLGFAYSEYDSLYGVPGEEESVSIDLKRQRFDAELEVNDPLEWIDALRIRAGYTDYEHAELEGGATGTVFTNEGWELRAEAAHVPVLFFDEGVVGLQLNDVDFAAIGEEAFTPPATTRSQAVFLSEHIHADPLHFELGGRLEWQTVTAETSGGDYADLAVSLAASVIWQIDEANSLALALQRSQRHPSSTELYADGPHLATEQYEVGGADLGIETAYGVDLSYKSEHTSWDSKLSVFYTDFSDYIFARNTGAVTDGLDTYQFTAVDARFWGFEGEVGFELYGSGATHVRLSLMSDYVRAENRDSGEDLPRIPPLRIGSRLDLSSGDWGFGAELRHAFAQHDTAPLETETDGYTEFNLDLSKRFDLGERNTVTFFARANNLLDETIRPHTSFLKDLAPLPGRNLTLGARFEF